MLHRQELVTTSTPKNPSFGLARTQ